MRKLHLLTRTRSHRGEEPDRTKEKNDTLFRKRLLSYPAVWVKEWRGKNDLTWCKNGQVREVVGNLGEGGHTVLFPGFLEANVSFSYLLLEASNLEQLFALVLNFRYSKLCQTLFEYTGILCESLGLYHNKLSLGLTSLVLSYFLFTGKYYLSTHNTPQLEVSLLSKE